MGLNPLYGQPVRKISVFFMPSRATRHNEKKCVLSVKESDFNEKISKFSRLLTDRAEVEIFQKDGNFTCIQA